MELESIKGLGEKTKEYLNKQNIYTIKDLVGFYPYRYEVLSPEVLDNTNKETTITINAKVVTEPTTAYIKSSLNVLKFNAETYGKVIRVSIFNRAYLKKSITIGKDVILTGKYDNIHNSFTASNLKLGILNDSLINPVYHSIKGIKNPKNIIVEAINYIEEDNNIIPKNYALKHNLITNKKALEYIHNPKTIEEVEKGRNRIIHEELFEFLFKVNYLKHLKDKEIGIAKNIDLELIKRFINSIPFKLTNDQLNGIKEGLNDLKSNKRMNRLVLGDVGSGKTIVATTLLLANASAGYQGVMLAPTEILATQHFKNLTKYFKDFDVTVELLTGKMTKKEKENVIKRCESGEVDILIGTHAVLGDKVSFKNLSLVVTDEQHRFGVKERDTLKLKGNKPDMLFLSATPIPRTYALTIYADLDVTEIKEKPSGRKDVITKVKKESELKDVLLKILEEVKLGHQVYIVSPSIEETDESIKSVYNLKEKFDIAFHSKIPIGILHGKLKKKEKESVMNDFLENNTKILISTTVIEVGVDVKNATVMVIFNADHFGLATLHQLRGRVGRNDIDSYCYLICNKEVERLNVLEESNDGFYISKKDFEFRGEGDIFGIKQSGDMNFNMLNLKRDYDKLLTLQSDVKEFISSKDYENNEYYKNIIKNIDFYN